MSIQNSNDRFSSYGSPNTRNKTCFLADDVSGHYPADFRKLKKSAHFAHLKGINEGRCLSLNRYNDPLITRLWARHHIEAIASQLGLTVREKAQARRYFVSLNREDLGLESNLVGFSVCAYVVEQNDRNGVRRCHPNVPNEKKDDQFQQMAESLGLNQRAIVKTYGKVRHRLDDTVPPIREDFDDSDHYRGEGI